MKKYFILLLGVFLVFIILGCTTDKGLDEGGNSSDDSSNNKPQFDYTCITMDKTNYYFKDKITVYLHNTDKNDFLAIIEYGKEPSNTHIILKRQVKDSTFEVFNAEKLNGAGIYTIFLYKNNCEVIDYLDIHIDDDDTNNYAISSAELNVSTDKLLSSISVIPSSTKELTYRLFWAKNNVRLNDYMAIKTIKSKDLESFDIELPKNLYMPKEADQIEIEVVEGVSNSYFLNVDDKLKLKDSKYLFTFNALSDLHIQSNNDSAIANSHLRLGLRDINASNSEAVFVVGDTINKSEESEYIFFKSILEDEKMATTKSFYHALGNHEYMYNTNMTNALNVFKQQFNLDSHYYSVELKGYKFIILGSDDPSSLGKMNSIQLQWLREELAQIDKDKPTFIFMHQPLKDTVAGSLETLFGQLDHGFGSSRTSLRELFKKYPNVILFSGHSHYTLEEYQTILYGNGVDASFVNCGAMSYLNATGLENIGGAEGYYVEVYEDYVLLKGKEFIYDKWIGGAQFVLPITI